MDTGSIPVWSTIWESSYIVVCYPEDRGIEVIPDTSHHRRMANSDEAVSLRGAPAHKNNRWSQAIAAPASNALMHMPVGDAPRRECVELDAQGDENLLRLLGDRLRVAT